MNTESGIERDRVQATLQFNTAQVPITQVEHRSAEEINQERVEQFLANGSVSSSVQSTYRPNSTTKPYRFDPFEQFALAHDKRPYQKDWNQNLMNGAMVSVALERSPKANGVCGHHSRWICSPRLRRPQSLGLLLVKTRHRPWRRVSSLYHLVFRRSTKRWIAESDLSIARGTNVPPQETN